MGFCSLHLYNYHAYFQKCAYNLHISNIIYTYYNFLMVPIVIIHHENITIDIIFVTLSCILLTVFNQTDFTIMAALICI